MLLLLYALSTGPMLRLSHATNLVSENRLEQIYAPLIFLCDNCTPVRDFFFWYIFELWGNSFYPGPK
jgi:hypothetical protein